MELDRLLLGFFLDDLDAMKAHWGEPLKSEYRGFWNLINRVAEEFLVGGIRRRLHLSYGGNMVKVAHCGPQNWLFGQQRFVD